MIYQVILSPRSLVVKSKHGNTYKIREMTVKIRRSSLISVFNEFSQNRCLQETLGQTSHIYRYLNLKHENIVYNRNTVWKSAKCIEKLSGSCKEDEKVVNLSVRVLVKETSLTQQSVFPMVKMMQSKLEQKILRIETCKK